MTQDILCELTIVLNINEELVLHVSSTEAFKFHKRMENFMSGRRSRTDNFSLHSLNGYVIRSDSVVHYKAITTDGETLVFALTPAS